jgi:hypothetical protein
MGKAKNTQNRMHVSFLLMISLNFSQKFEQKKKGKLFFDLRKIVLSFYESYKGKNLWWEKFFLLLCFCDIFRLFRESIKMWRGQRLSENFSFQIEAQIQRVLFIYGKSFFVWDKGCCRLTKEFI